MKTSGWIVMGGMWYAFKTNTRNHADKLSIFQFSVALELTGHLQPTLIEGY